MLGRATLATARGRLATAATMISAERTQPARRGPVDWAVCVVAGVPVIAALRKVTPQNSAAGRGGDRGDRRAGSSADGGAPGGDLRPPLRTSRPSPLILGVEVA